MFVESAAGFLSRERARPCEAVKMEAREKQARRKCAGLVATKTVSVSLVYNSIASVVFCFRGVFEGAGISPYDRSGITVPIDFPSCWLCFRLCIDRQITTAGESSRIDRGDGVGDGDGSEAEAVVESVFTNKGDGVGDGDGSEAGAVVERVITDRGDGIWDGDGSEVEAVGESKPPDGSDGVGNGKGFRCLSASILHQKGAVLGVKIAVNGLI